MGYTDEFIEWARSVPKSRRAARALEFILERGTVTTGDLQAAGYDHPPRAVRDLKDAGFLITSELVNVEGRRMSQYTLLDTITEGFAQRRPIPNSFRTKLFEAHDHKCEVCGGTFVGRMLQADHRIPFHVNGDAPTFELADFMPLCGSDNRAKSMSCENCPNWEIRDPDTCRTCYWSDPTDYEHVATHEERRLTITVQGSEATDIDRAARAAAAAGYSFRDYVIRRLKS